MSRFYTKSDSESEFSSSEDEIQAKPVTNRAYIHMSDDDEKTKRVAKSTKDKKFEDLQSVIKNLRNHKKIKDMSNVLNDFDELCKVYEKAKKIIDKSTSRIFIKCLVELEDFVNENWDDTEGRKAMSKNNSKGLTALRQKLKKHTKEFEAELNEYRENPDPEVLDVEEKEADEFSEDEFSDDDIEMPKQAADSKKERHDQDDDSDEEDWNEDVDNESSESDEEARPITQLNADYFRKKAPADGDVEGKKEKEEKKLKVEGKKKKKKDEKKLKVKEAEDSGNEGLGEWEKVGPSFAAVEKPELFPKDAEITVKTVLDKLSELISGRGKKGTDRMMQIELLVDLREIGGEKNLGDAVDCKIIFSIIAAIFDYNQSVASSMKPEMWEKCLDYIKEVLAILLNNIDTIVVGDHVADDSENFDGTKLPYRIRGCMLTVVERMDHEFTMMLQDCDPRDHEEYMKRLRDETNVCQIIEDLEKYLIGHASDEELCRLFMKRIQHIYYKFDKKSCGRSEETMTDPKNSRMELDRLCMFIYTKDATDRIRACAILSHIYHHALHDRFYEARDLMLMSHLQDSIQRSDIPTQILYNRAMVQLGLCAFRQGLIRDAHDCLVDIQSSRRARELLAQGLLPQRQQERSPEQEKKDKRRLLPYHTHINLELLECVYLVSAMLIEIPNMAAHDFDIRRRMISKNFHHVLRENERQTLVGPPENMREHVVAACKAMKTGDWKACLGFIINEKMNEKVWDRFSNKEDVKQMISLKIQEESLRTYLFAYSYIYDSLSFDNLSELCGLPVASIHCIISKMILNKQLMASIDDLTSTIVMHRSEPTHLQSLALQLCDKLGQVMDHNEEHMEMKNIGDAFPSNRDNYSSAVNRFFNDKSRIKAFLEKLEVLDFIPGDFGGDLERFCFIDEWAHPIIGDVAIIQTGNDVEKLFWQMLDTSADFNPETPYRRAMYIRNLKRFGKLLLSKYDSRFNQQWPHMFEAWVTFSDCREKSGCAAIYRDEILLVKNLEHRWTLPKGKLELWEKSHKAAERELKEESGVVHIVSSRDESEFDREQNTRIYIIYVSEREKAMTKLPDMKEILGIG